MYYTFMERNKLKEILSLYSNKTSTIVSWMNGNRRPTYKTILLLNRKHNIPFEAWENIKDFYSETSSKRGEEKRDLTTMDF